MPARATAELCDAARIGFSGLGAAPGLQEVALDAMARWLDEPAYAANRPQLQALVLQGRWATLLDSFYRVLPFGTGGRRGTVGIGTNRFNAWTLGNSVQGHSAWLRRTRGEGELCVVIAYDVRCFRDLGGAYVPGIPNPVLGLTSRDFALLATEVYAAAGITVWMPPAGSFLSTPELSFAIRWLRADGGLNISASHNPPDDNGGKFYTHTGAQEIPPRDEQMAALVGSVTFIDRMQVDRARAAGLVRELGPEVHEAYVQANLACARSPRARSARVVFTPLQGTGAATVGEVLDRAGFACEREPTQAEPDGSFSAVPFRVPNPEVPRALDAAVAHGERVGADLVLACDPDADRLGLSVREHTKDPTVTDPVRWRFFTGNEIAALICHYLLTHRPTVAPPLVLTTEVTSTLLSRIARSHGARVAGHLLVGFKYIGDALDQVERLGRFGGVPASLGDFALGAEESHGVLVTPAIRDKDAAGGALLLAELASVEKERGRTLCDTLRDIWRAQGYVRNEIVNTVMNGATGRERIEAIQRRFRESPPESISGRPVTAFRDHQDPGGVFGPIRSETDRASRDVLVFELGPDARVIVRPSGTEPKNKVYVEVVGQASEPLSTEIPRVNREARALAEDFVLLMLDAVGFHPPRWALRASDLVSIEHKVHFAEVVLPALCRRLEGTKGEVGQEVAHWLDAAIAPYGKDARGLLSDAVLAFVETTQPPAGAGLLRLFG